LVQIPSAVQNLSSSQNFHGHYAVTLTSDPMTPKTFPTMPTHIMNIVPGFIEIPPLSTEISRHR